MAQEPATKDEWSEVWDARLKALTRILGKPDDKVFHSLVPLYLGGAADVQAFPEYVKGVTYVTVDMTGGHADQIPTSLGNYELMICMKEEEPKAADLISKLGRYTLDAKLEPGETMDIENFFGDKTIRALIFSYPSELPAHFEVLGKPCYLLLCTGITAQELSYKKAKGGDKLLELLKEYNVFPYTVPSRQSVPPLRGN